MLITFEGGDGVGKTTQIELLMRHICASGKDVICARDWDAEDALAIEDFKGDAKAEVEFYSMLRRRNIMQNILPALDAGKIVICDRYVDSTIVYQGCGLGYDIADIKLISQGMLGADKRLVPDVIFILDLDPEIGKARVKARKGEDFYYDAMDMEFARKIRQGFLDVAEKKIDVYNFSDKQPKYCIIDASQDVLSISSCIAPVLRSQH